jgi:hypothetical protein
VPLPVPKSAGPFPKLSQPAERSVLTNIAETPLAQFSNKHSHPIFVHRIVRYFAKALDFVPRFFDARGKRGKSEDYKEFRFASEEQEQITALQIARFSIGFGVPAATGSTADTTMCIPCPTRR